LQLFSGYCDERIRPWNQRNTQERRDGEYYRESWNAAAAVTPSFISITSWNEWHEGSQIEDCMCVAPAYAAFEPNSACSDSVSTLPELHFSRLQSGQHILQMRNLNGRILHPNQNTGGNIFKRVACARIVTPTSRDYGIGGPSMYRQLTLELVNDAKAKRKR
jgi:hypothetical protein